MPRARTFILLLWVLILHYIGFCTLVHVGRGLRYSCFFRYNNESRFREETDRREKAVAHISDLIARGWHPPASAGGSRPLICIAIIATGNDTVPARAAARYTMQCVSSLVTHIKPEEWPLVSLYLVAPRHESGDAKILRSVLPAIDVPDRTVYPLPKEGWARLQQADFLLALEHCSMNAPYALLLEDDTIASSNFVRVLLDIIAKADYYTQQFWRRDKDWAFVKLWFTEFWLGWGNDTIHQLMLICVTTALISYLLLYCLWKWPRRTSIYASLYVAALLAVVLYCLGRQHFFAFPSGLWEYDTGCCTVATIFNSRTAGRIISSMRVANQTNPHDVFLSTAARESKLRVFHYVPHLFQHIGRVSSSWDKQHRSWKLMKESLSFRE